jgi:hypothetical protein
MKPDADAAGGGALAAGVGAADGIGNSLAAALAALGALAEGAGELPGAGLSSQAPHSSAKHTAIVRFVVITRAMRASIWPESAPSQRLCPTGDHTPATSDFQAIAGNPLRPRSGA